MAASNESIRITSVSKWLRGLLLVMLIVAVMGFNVFASPLGLAVDSDDIDKQLQLFLFISSLGAIFAQPTLLSVWMLLANSAPVARISFGLLMLLLICATGAVGVFMVEGQSNNEVAAFPLMLALQAAAIVPLLLAIRRFTRWRLDLSAAELKMPSVPSQFSIRSLLLWTLEIGLLAGMLQFLYRHRVVDENRSLIPADAILFMVIAGVLLSIPAIAAAWMFLGRGRIMLVGATMTLVASSMCGGIAYWVTVATGEDAPLEAIVQFGSAMTGVILMAAFVYFVLRAFGYRIIRIPKADVSAAAAGTLRDEFKEHSCVPKLRWQFAAAMLMTLGVCASIGWLAKTIIPERLEAHKMIAEQRRWGELGFECETRTIDKGATTVTHVVALTLKPNHQLRQSQLLAIDELDELLPMQVYGMGRNVNAELQELAKVKRARSLTLTGASISGADMALIGAMTGLETLLMAGSVVTDAGFEAVANLKNLQVLNVSGTAISDAALESLHGLKSLRQINLRKSAVTADGVQKLREALPQAEVQWQ